jgi:hypothetical protein
VRNTSTARPSAGFGARSIRHRFSARLTSPEIVEEAWSAADAKHRIVLVP